MPGLEQAARAAALLLPCRGNSGRLRQNLAHEIAMHASHQGYANVGRHLAALALARKPFARGVNEDPTQQAFRLRAGNPELEKQLDQRLDGRHRGARQGGLCFWHMP
jgi:hypothetical protein